MMRLTYGKQNIEQYKRLIELGRVRNFITEMLQFGIAILF